MENDLVYWKRVVGPGPLAKHLQRRARSHQAARAQADNAGCRFRLRQQRPSTASTCRPCGPCHHCPLSSKGVARKREKFSSSPLYSSPSPSASLRLDAPLRARCRRHRAAELSARAAALRAPSPPQSRASPVTSSSSGTKESCRRVRREPHRRPAAYNSTAGANGHRAVLLSLIPHCAVRRRVPPRRQPPPAAVWCRLHDRELSRDAPVLADPAIDADDPSTGLAPVPPSAPTTTAVEEPTR
jgi:hypothetical protein